VTRACSSSRSPIALALLACLAPATAAHAIFGGAPDTSRTAVGFVYDTQTDSYCSGVLIAPTVLLTAAHCLPPGRNALDFLVSFDSTPLTAGSFAGVSEIHANPAFDSIDPDHDLGVVVLGAAAVPTPLRWLASDPGGVYATGRTIVASGYGLTSIGGDEGTRRSVSIDIDETFPLSFKHDQTDGHGPCAGDSGGPAIATIGGIETVIGVWIYADQNCASSSVFQRTDSEASFIGQFAPEPGGTASVLCALAALFLSARRRG
jgi:hypothetical protein